MKTIGQGIRIVIVGGCVEFEMKWMLSNIVRRESGNRSAQRHNERREKLRKTEVEGGRSRPFRLRVAEN